MRVTIRRVGGHLPTFQPSRIVDGQDLDAETRAELEEFVEKTPRKTSAPHPDAFLYVFELERGGRKVTTSASASEVPEQLRRLLPAVGKK
jgi:hypothetical protein